MFGKKVSKFTNSEIKYSTTETTRRNNLIRLAKNSAFLLLIVITLPLFTLAISRLSIMFTGLVFEKTLINYAAVPISISKIASETSKNLSALYMKIPLIGKMYESPYDISKISASAAEIQGDYRNIVKAFAQFISQTSEESSDNNMELIREISLDLGTFYTKISFLESEISKNEALQRSFGNKVFSDMELTDVKEKTLLIKKVISQSDDTLGAENPKNYLVLLEDNSVIRPTGGKIYAFGVVTLSDAKISNLQFFNFQDVDKKILGKVEPPQPLKKYFGKESWYLSESNWYADFPSSAEKAEWFLDKGLDISVDGVVSLDSTALNELSKLIKSDVLFSEDNPENDELKSFLTDLTKQNDKNTYSLISKILDLINEKHILLFVHNNDARVALNDLGWDGSIKNINCNLECYSDIVGFTESANGFGSENIKKEATLKISIEEGLVKKDLIIFVENKNNLEYKTYVRALSNANSGFTPVMITSDSGESEIYPDIYGVGGLKEAGVYLEFKPFETKAIRYSWENSVDNFSSINRYALLFRKQPGDSEYPIEIDLVSSTKNIDNSAPSYSLTSDGVWSYNTSLLSDFVSNFLFD